MAGVKGRSGRKDTIWSDALRIAVNGSTPDGRKKLRALAERVVDSALAGDIAAAKEIGDRLDGKAHQTSEAVVENRHHYVIETPAPAATVDEWQQQHGANKLIQ